MKKGQIIGVVIALIILVGLIIFASSRTLDDGHLKIDGIRVKIAEGTLMVEDCNESTKNAAYCEKDITINGNKNKLVFEYKDFKENGYPSTVVATINGHEFFKKEDLNIETIGSGEYPIFRNFKVMDNYLVFTYTDGSNGRTTTLYAIDSEGNIILKDKEIDKDNMAIKDYTAFISYEDNVITIYATRVVQDILYKDDNICKANPKDIVEAYYTYTLKDGKFTKKQTKTITATEFIKDKGMKCDE